jgi:hypothetical protein
MRWLQGTCIIKTIGNPYLKWNIVPASIASKQVLLKECAPDHACRKSKQQQVNGGDGQTDPKNRRGKNSIVDTNKNEPS